MDQSTTLSDLITKQTQLLEKYNYAFFLLEKKSGDYSEQLRLATEDAIKQLKAEIEDLDVEATITKLRGESAKLNQELKATVEAEIKKIGAENYIQKLQDETKKAIADIKDFVKVYMVDFQHTLPRELDSNTKYTFKIIGGSTGSTFKIDTKSIFAVSKVSGISAGEEITITTPTVKDDEIVSYEIAITEVKKDGIENTKIVDVEVGYENAVGEVVYDKSGTYTFIVPNGVKKISAVAVGAGGGGNRNWSGYAGHGGALAYANDIAVKAGDKITVVVGKGGASGNSSSSSQAGGDSYLSLNGTKLFTAQGGRGGNTNTRAKYISGAVTCYGGLGGIGGNNGSHQYGGGGGAGGYTGNGGNGTHNARNGSGYTSVRQGSGGAGNGGAGYESSTYSFGGGGGAGLYGLEGCSQPIADVPSNSNSFYNSSYYGGKSGSCGFAGAGNTNSSETLINGRGEAYTAYHGEGGKFGGGGAGGGTLVSNNSNFCRGGDGGVRIIWGKGRNFPNNAR